MSSRFVENLEEVPITHPHLNVSLEDILAEESRKRSTSQSSDQSHADRSGSDSLPSPTSPTSDSKMNLLKRRALALGSKKGRRDS
jgi:lariat debranching enzyme